MRTKHDHDGKMLPKISVVFLTFNRLVTLKPTLESFLANTDYPRERLELIVADDASPPSVQDEIRRMPFDTFCLSSKNAGMGANNNRGLAAATGELILQLQDDWQCLGPATYLHSAVEALEASPETGLVLLRPSPNSPPIQNVVTLRSGALRIYKNHPEMFISSVSQHAYSDWPHLKRKTFVEAIGFYREGCPMWETELDYSQRVNRQNEWFVGDLFPLDAFLHIGEPYSFNWPWKKRVEAQIRQIPGGATLLAAYRRVRRRER